MAVPQNPQGIWLQRKTRRRYLKWLGEQLGLRSMEDWYCVTRDDFEQNHGSNLLKMYGGSPYQLLKDAFPRYAWKEWMFARVPLGFWNEGENRRRYMQWLGKQLRYRRPEDWRHVRRRDFLEHCGGGFLTTVHSYVDVLREHFPNLDWSGTRADEN